MVDVIRCHVICVKRENGKIIGMKIKCPDEPEADYTLDQIYQLQAHRRGESSEIPEGTRGGIQDFFIKTIHHGDTLMLIDNVEGELKIIAPGNDEINIPDCE